MHDDIAHFELVKRQNKKIVRNLLREKHTMRVSAVAHETGLSYPTVSNLLKELSETGEVFEDAQTVCRGGRPAVQYSLNAEYKSGIIMILEKDGLRYVVVDAFCNEIERGIFPLTDENITKEEFVSNVRELKQKYINIKTIALGIPGVAIEGDIKFLDVFPDLEGSELAERLRNELGVQLVVENDSNAMALAQINGNESFAHIIYLRKCMGTGIVINGSLFWGIGGYAGKFESICQHLEEPVPAMVEVVKYITAVLNLGKVYISADCPMDKDAIIDGLHAFFMEETIPEVILVNDPVLVYERGLKERLLIIWREEVD